MISSRGVVVVVIGVTLGCAARPAKTPGAEAPRQDLIVLMADQNGTTGHVMVSSPHGRVDLAAARESTRVAPGSPPTPVVKMSESDVRAVFGRTLAALPPAPESFTLLFRFESELLTDESRATLRRVLGAVKTRPFPEVSVRGHTDTTGTAKRNFELGLKRAKLVRGLLIATGIDPASIDVISHGESELLIPTADGVLEPRNRRVEITVR